MILCDTNIIIEIYRNNPAIISEATAIVADNQIVISDVTRAEMLVGARNKLEMQSLSKELAQLQILPLCEEISELSIQLLTQYHLSHGLDYHDSLIAATAIFHDIYLFTLNTKDFVFIPNLKIYSTV
jgi:predicted nucleic acid-binding protein